MIKSVEHLRELLREQDFNDSIVFESPHYLPAVLGHSEDGRVVYDYDKMVDFIAEQDGLDIMEAEMWVDENCAPEAYSERGKAPIILHKFVC